MHFDTSCIICDWTLPRLVILAPKVALLSWRLDDCYAITEKVHWKENMRGKAAKYTESPNTVNAKSHPIQCPVTRNKVRSVQVTPVISQASSVSAQSSYERDKMQHIQENAVGSKTSPVLSRGTHESNKVQSNQENSVIAKASSVSSQTVYDSSKIQNIQENPIGSKAVDSQSTCDSSMTFGENEQATVVTKVPKVIHPNGQNSRFEEKNVVGNMSQNARGQNEALSSIKPREVERRTYLPARNEANNYVTFQNVTSKVSSVISARYAEPRGLQNHCAEPKIADLRRGFIHQQTINGSDIEYQNDVKTMFTGLPASELTHQQQQPTSKLKELDNLAQVDSSRQIRDGSSNSDLRPTPAKEAEQASQLDLPSSKSNGSGTVAAHVTTLTGNSLTIKSGTKEVLLVFMNPPQSVNGRGGQTSETDNGNIFQEREIPATLKSIPAASTATATNTVGGRVLHSDSQEMAPQSTCHSTGNESNITNETSSCENRIRDVRADQTNDDNYYRRSFHKLERPVPISLQPHRPLLSAAISEPQTNIAVGANSPILEQNTISSDENIVDSKRDLIPVRESSAQGFSRNFDASDAYIDSTQDLLPFREVSAQTLPRSCCRNEVYTANTPYQNNELQMQFPPLVPSSAYRDDAGLNERTLLSEHPAVYHYGRDQLSSHEDPVSEAHFQAQVPLMGQRSLYGRLPSYGQHTFRNPYRDDFMDIAPEPTYRVHREPIGVFRCRRFGPSYGGQCAYHLPLRNAERAHRTSFMDMRPHIYRRTMYPEQPFCGYVDGGNMFFLNRY